MALFLTILIEAFALSILTYKKADALRRLILWSMPINILTQPLFSLWLQKALHGQDHLWWPYFIGGECAVIIIETALFFFVLSKYKITLQTCAFYAGLANFCSLGIGLFLPI